MNSGTRGWTEVLLSEVVGQRTEKAIPTNGDTRPYVALEHLEQGRPAILGWSAAGTATSPKTVFRQGDVLFGKLRPNLQKAAAVPFDGLCSTDILALFVVDQIDARFLLQLSHWKPLQRHAIATSSGTKMPRTSWKQLGEFKFSLPPISEQRKIATILSSVDDAIDKTQAVIDQVAVIRRATVHELLIKGLPGRHTRFKRTTIGVIPEEWGLARLSDVASVQTGLAKNKANAGPLSVPYLRVANVQDGFLKLTEVKSVRVSADKISRYSLRAGDVLFTEGGDSDKLGRGAVWNSEIEPCIHQNHIFVARSLRSIRPMFLSLYGGSSRGKAYFLNCSKQTTNLASMNSTQLKNLPVPIPGMDEQDQILKRIKAVDDRLKTENECHRQLSGLKLALMSVLLTGDLRVVSEPGAS